MGRKRKYKKLEVRLHGLPIGTLYQEATGHLTFEYSEKWAMHPHAIPISLSMPLQTERFAPEVTTAFFAGVLPDNEGIRATLAKALEVSPRNPFGLLSKIGHDCAGALQIVPEGSPYTDEAEQIVEWKTDEEIAELIRSLPRRPLGVTADKEFRISLAGAQHKTAVVMRDGDVGLPQGDTPSTHIFKPPMAGLDGIVENETFCMMLAQETGLPTANVKVLTFEDQKVISVERYDRHIEDDGTIKRIHQEDFCQALGIHPDHKYESDGGPNVSDCVRLLERTDAVYENQIIFLDALIFNFLIGGTDAHAKNYSLLLETDGSIKLAPLYDIACGLVYDELAETDRMSMKIGGKKKFNDVMPRHWERMAKDARIDIDLVNTRLRKMATSLPELATKTQKMCDIDHKVIPQIVELITARCALTLKRMA
ncbi:type II toxin-antitoxin system HipA family toxin [Terasakiella sp.]|uniref:type II toxin-antitoxin system HipA family toxin n=1 Tax=Terasakiella sp. TaxID=2034861 RepID=UPI003AA98C57